MKQDILQVRPKMFDLISIGDTFVDTIIPLIDAKVEGRMLILTFGAKIPVGLSASTVGGNAANNAVGSARLGLKTAIYTNVGNKDEDEWDNRIIAKFKKEKVDTRYVCETSELPSGHNIILDFKSERTILIHHQPWKYQLPDLDKTKWVYLTSMSESYTKSNIIEQIINFINRSGARLCYQPGTVQIRLGFRKNNKLMVLSDLFIVNLEEAKIFLGFDAGEKIPVKKLLVKLADLGPKMVVITDSTNGSYGFDGENFYQMGIFPAKVIQVTGCGDAYSTGVVAGLFYGENLAGAMRWGAANSASVCEEIGPQAGLLTYHQIKEKLKNHPKISARQL